MTQSSVKQGAQCGTQAQLHLRQPWRWLLSFAIGVGSMQSTAEELKITTADDGAVWVVETTSIKVPESLHEVYADMIIYRPNNTAPLRFHMKFTDCDKSTGTYMVLQKDQPIRYGGWSYQNSDDTAYTMTDIVGGFMCRPRVLVERP